MILKRRIETLERTWPRRRSFADLLTQAQQLVRLTGISHDTAFAQLLEGATNDELDDMIVEARAAGVKEPETVPGQLTWEAWKSGR
jgi:hypothetical protein